MLSAAAITCSGRNGTCIVLPRVLANQPRGAPRKAEHVRADRVQCSCDAFKQGMPGQMLAKAEGCAAHLGLGSSGRRKR